MNKTKSIICFIISIAVVLFLGYVVMFGVGGRHTGSAQNVTQGLDLMGGTSVSYQVDDSKTKSFTATDLEDTRLKLENRVHTFSSEATAYKEGEDNNHSSKDYYDQKINDSFYRAAASILFSAHVTPTPFSCFIFHYF